MRGGTHEGARPFESTRSSSFPPNGFTFEVWAGVIAVMIYSPRGSFSVPTRRN